MRWLKIVAFLLLSVWGILLMYLSSSMLHSSPSIAEYSTISKEIQSLVERVDEGSKNLQVTVERLNLAKGFTTFASTNSVRFAHEVLRNRAINFAREIFYASSATLAEVTKRLTDKHAGDLEAAVTSLESLRERIDEMTRYLEVDLDGLGRVDHLAESRRRELDKLSELVQRRIEKLQNPPDCSKAKILLVSLDRPCAFGCNAHHLAYCMQLAYASGRTLLMIGKEFQYGKWWSNNFLPLSKTCSTKEYDNMELFSSDKEAHSTARVAFCPYIVDNSRTEWLPPAVPADLAPDLTRLHAAPSVWFIGQLLTFLMRQTPQFARLLNDTLASYGLTSHRQVPVAGLHIRRTDKINSEASFHELKEYMVYVERRFRFWDAQQQMMSRSKEWTGDLQPHYTSTTPRQIFIATDDPSVFDDARKKYPNYVFHGDVKRAESAGVNERGKQDSITGVALDIIVLSKADYIVCTFSSQVCRISYELMQTRHHELGDASGLAQSLDDLYYYGGQQPVLPEMIIGDETTGLKPGQHVSVAGNHWNGFALINNVPNHIHTLIPAYKYRPRVLAVPMGNFNE